MKVNGVLLAWKNIYITRVGIGCWARNPFAMLVPRPGSAAGPVVEVEPHAAVRALCRCKTFLGVDARKMEKLFVEHVAHHRPLASERLVAGSIFTHSGERLDDLFFIQGGVVVAWQIPVSTLETPYLLGEYELLTAMPQWMATYSAYTDAQLLRLPADLMRRVLQSNPEVRRNIRRALYTRIGRYYWTSLATSGTNKSKVAAALVSRLALEDRDVAGDHDVTINISQKELCRLTNTSRPGVSKGLKELVDDGLVALQRPSYMTGDMIIRSVDALKEEAYRSFRDDVLERLPTLL